MSALVGPRDLGATLRAQWRRLVNCCVGWDQASVYVENNRQTKGLVWSGTRPAVRNTRQAIFSYASQCGQLTIVHSPGHSCDLERDAFSHAPLSVGAQEFAIPFVSVGSMRLQILGNLPRRGRGRVNGPNRIVKRVQQFCAFTHGESISEVAS